jgi:hypothetical protein
VSAALTDLGPELEATVTQLGSQTEQQYPEWYRARFANFYAYSSGVEGFGPSRSAHLEAA